MAEAITQTQKRCLFQPKNTDTYFLFFKSLQENIDWRYSSEVPHWGTSNEYPDQTAPLGAVWAGSILFAVSKK